MGNTSGRLFRITTFGESHGLGLGAVIDGCPPGLDLDLTALQADLDRRRPGQSHLTTPRKERDRVRIVSGLLDGRTTGTPIALLFDNEDQAPRDYDGVRSLYRPGHADYTYTARFGLRDHRGGGRASARETVARVAAAAVARQFLNTRYGIEVVAWVDAVGGIAARVDPETVTRDEIEASLVRCPHPQRSREMIELVESVQAEGDTVGGIVGAVARGVPPGWGAPVFDRLEADLAKACLSLPACKGFEIGSGFQGTTMRGSAHNDSFEMRDGHPFPVTNRAGGVLGGITTGAAVYGRCAFKPVSTHFKQQQTVTDSGDAITFRNEGRHDPCVVPRAVPLVEAAFLLTLADHALQAAAVHG